MSRDERSSAGSSASTTSTAPPPIMIVGRLTYCLHLAAAAPRRGGSRATTTTTTTAHPNDQDSNRRGDPPLVGDSDKRDDKDAFSVAGWILETVPPEDGGGGAPCCYLVSLPYDASSQGSDLFHLPNGTVSSSLDVMVDQYTAIPLSLPATSTATTTTDIRPTMLLEIRRLRPQPTARSTNHNHNREDDRKDDREDDPDVWTLRQLARLEWVDRCLTVSQDDSSQQEPQPAPRRKKPFYYTLQATVAVLSPVLTMDPKDPFVLMELREEQSHDQDESTAPRTTSTTVRSCIVVVRGCAALSAALRLVPLRDAVQLRRVVQQKWRIPHLLVQHWNKTNTNHHSSNNLAPSKVFVVDRPEQLWRIPSASQSPWLHSPASSTNASHRCVVQGTIVACHYKQKRLHSMELALRTSPDDHNPRNNRTIPQLLWTLWVAYFPMSTSLQLSLRPGAVIRVAHSQSLDLHGAGCATVRTHVSIVQFAPSPPLLTSMMRLPTNAYLWVSRPPRSYAELAEHWPRGGARPSRVQARRSPRNAYAEFFQADHAGDATVPLDRLHEVALHDMEQRLDQPPGQSDNNIRVGWTASIHLSAEQLLRRNGHGDAPSLGTAGELRLAETTTMTGATSGWLSNGTVVIPVVFHGDSSSRTQEPTQPSTAPSSSSGPSLVSIQCMVVSCICLATLDVVRGATATTRGAPPTRIHLPPYHRTNNEEGVDRGACALIRTHRGIFVVSMFVVSHGSSPLVQSGSDTTTTTTISKTTTFQRGMEHDSDPSSPDPDSRNNNNNHPSTRVTSIADALAGQLDSSFRDVTTSSSSSSSSMWLVGLLARSIFRAFRIKAGKYSGCTLTLAHAPSSRVAADRVSVLQSVEIMPPMAMDLSHRYGFFQNTLSSLAERDVLDDHISLGLAWWMLASCAQQCALLGGGWDEANDPSGTCSSRSTTMGVLVYLPSSSVVQSDQTRGYTRFRCRMADMVASVRFFARSPDNTCRLTYDSDISFDFIGGPKQLQGMLDRRPPRRRLGQPAHGEMLWRPVDAGIPCCTIMSLFAAVCRDLRTDSRCNLCPSLVRRVRGATFLGVSYCRVFAECTKCYSSLRDSRTLDNNAPNKKRKKSDGGVVASVSIADLDRVTYWHRPLPTNPGLEHAADQELPALPPPASTPTELRSGRDITPLQCPNSCQVDKYGGIKWECSGTLDDGTGQARLFSEREASLCLLGMSAETMELIDHGAWLNEDGIVFSKTTPPKAYLRHAILTARSLAETHKRSFHRKKRPLQDKDVMAFLTPTARAEYLLQHHCRSLAPVRELDYYVRCKPLSDSVTHVKQTDIEVFPGNDVATYTLPPLKLQLIDCCVDTRSNAAGEADGEEELAG